MQEAIDRISAEKLEIETQAAEQAETCQQLTEANNTLSARALTLAEEAATSSDGVRKRLEAELAECNANLKKANAEIDSMRESQQVQQMALMEELNVVQTENDSQSPGSTSSQKVKTVNPFFGLHFPFIDTIFFVTCTYSHLLFHSPTRLQIFY